MLSEIKNIISTWGLSYFGRYYSLYQGVVESNEDSEEFVGRLKVKVPGLFGDEVLEEWAFPRGAYAGKSIGFFAIPEKGDVVWVSFKEGDPNYPLWEGGWWGSGDAPSYAKNNGNKPTNKVWQSTSGHRIELDDKQGIEVVRVYSKHQHGIELTAAGASIIAPTGKKIFLGGLDAAAEPALLGDKTEDVLNDIKAILTQIQGTMQAIATADTTPAVTTSTVVTAISGTPTVLTYATSLGTLAGQIGTAITALSTKIAIIKSNKVKLD